MENAAKALLIAGTILLAIIMVSVAIYLYSLYSNQADQYSETMSEIELEKFNSKFEVYIDRTDITAQEIVSVVNLAKEYDNQIQIHLGGTRLRFTTSTPEEFIKNNQNKLFSCEWSASNPKYENGKITILKFKEV